MMDYQIVNSIKKDLELELSQGESLDNIKDRSGEIIDSHLPIYNYQILKEWSEMPADYDNRGAQELGHSGEPDILRLMTLDLYLYYSDLFSEAISELEQEIKDKESVSA